MNIDINAIPEPFRGFLTNEKKDIAIASIEPPPKKQANPSEMQDLMFLAAILMMTND